MVPFVNPDVPDQFQRLFTMQVLHGGYESLFFLLQVVEDCVAALKKYYFAASSFLKSV
jgi:hypothetical protein